MSIYASEAQNRSNKPTRIIERAPSVTEVIPGKSQLMGANNNGGVSFFLLDNWGIFERFLMIGVVNGQYSPTIKGVTPVKAGFDTVSTCAKEDPIRAAALVLEISAGGRAPKNDPAIAALAIMASIPVSAEAAWAILPKVCRIGTHLFQFVNIYNEIGKWNAAAKRAVAAWYNRPEDRLAVQMLKYQNREGWTHRDVLRLAHVKPTSEIQNAIFKQAVTKEFSTNLPALYDVVRRLNSGDLTSAQVVALIEQHSDLTWEMIPTKYLSDVSVLMPLLPNMGLTAMIRKLGTFTSHGVFDNASARQIAEQKFSNQESLHRQRVHPLTIYAALKQYKKGAGEKGSSTWTPAKQITDSLDSAFYLAFKPSENTGEHYLVGADISGSMQSYAVLGNPLLVASEVAVIMAMAAVREQENAEIVGFNHKLVKLGITPNMTLQTAMHAYTRMGWDGGSTDAGKVFEYALTNKTPVEKFVVITDNDINTGKQPASLLKSYRQRSGIGAKMAVIATSLSNFSIADPTDRYSIDIAGFDSAAPAIIAGL